MLLWLTIALHITCAVASDVNERTSVINSDIQHQSNITNFETTEDDLSELIQTDEETAEVQYNQLSLVTRYAGTGYNLIRGNPEGDFRKGGVDPGIKTTNEIFEHTYTKRKRVFYRRRTMQVPDQMNFHMSQSCAESHIVKAYSGRKSYMKELETSVSVSGGYSGLFASVSFSLSAGMARAEAMTQRRKSIVIQKNKICNYGRARYLYENAVAREHGYVLSKSFKNSVKFQLKKRYNKREYMQFIEKWGTHIIITVDVGTREILRTSSTYTQVYKYLKKKNSLSTTVGGRYGPYSASASFSIKTLNENINQNTRLGRSSRKFTIGSRDVPLPIHLDLKLISKALDTNWWGGVLVWRRYGINLKQRNLIRALKEYPAYVRAKKNNDPLIKVKLRVQWPDGTYALPMAKWGCPHGWTSGWRYQDTEDRRNANRKSPQITSKMRLYATTNIRFYYCVKNIRGNSGNRWPKGTYCIAKKGHCPGGFRDGGIKWDDEDSRNNNKRWGVLPDGVYNKDTKVYYCCRNDANHNTPMSLPTTRPFILYRYGGRCQNVRGMRKDPIWIRWDDEDSRNRDGCWGSHPDSTCRANQLLQMCYYTR